MVRILTSQYKGISPQRLFPGVNWGHCVIKYVCVQFYQVILLTSL